MRWTGVLVLGAVFVAVAACAGSAKPPLMPALEPTPAAPPTEEPTATAAATPEPPPKEAPVDVKRCPTKKCPAVKVDKLASITLERTACYGTCPVYSVTLRADGLVKWHGVDHVEHTGDETKKVAPILAKAVLEYAATSCFYGMDAAYEYAVTDHPHAITTMVASGKKKVVKHYLVSDRIIADEGACAPPEALSSLESKIDEVAGTRELIGDPKGKAGPHAKP